VRAEQVAPAEFAAVVADEDVVTVNVHVPDEGSILGTDAAIPFDQITTSVGELPKERTTALAVYCRTGLMSTEAVQTLRDLGYTDVVELRGGMEAWTADGRELLTPVD
jgi:rhodanese-related sulfurtransferase